VQIVLCMASKRKKSNAISVKLVVVGDGGAGKTTLIHMFMFHNFIEEYEPTKADSFRKNMDINQQSVSVEVLDTAGQEELMRETYYKSGEGFMCVYSITSKASFDAIHGFYEQICNVKETDSVPLLLVGTKCDLNDKREVQTSEGKDLATKMNCLFTEITAKDKDQVDNSFLELVNLLIQTKEDAAISAKQASKCHCVVI